jgi:Bacterial HORMA domain family 1
MTTSYTVSETFSITHARHIASRVAGDLRLMSSYYGRPTLPEVDDYLEEIAQLLVKGYLGTFEVGYRRDGKRVFTLLYEVLANGTLSDSRAGGVPTDADITGASCFSYVTYARDDAARAAFLAGLPVQRTGGPEPVDGDGYWVHDDRSYASGGVGLRRGRFVPK